MKQLDGKRDDNVSMKFKALEDYGWYKDGDVFRLRTEPSYTVSFSYIYATRYTGLVRYLKRVARRSKPEGTIKALAAACLFGLMSIASLIALGIGCF